MKLIVGLGNPGKAYAHNHRDLAFRCLNCFAKLSIIGNSLAYVNF